MSLDEFPVSRKLLNNYLKYLEMDSSTYSRWRNIYSRKSKIQHKQDLHTTSYLLTQQDGNSSSDWCRAFSPTSYHLKDNLPSGQDINISHFAPSYLLLRLNSGWIWWDATSFSAQPHLRNSGSSEGMVLLRILGPQLSLAQLIKWWFCTGRGKLRRYEPLGVPALRSQLLK